MEPAMKKVGAAMRQQYYCVERETKLYLVLDNTGGHGTN